jgi:hypothetical protein
MSVAFYLQDPRFWHDEFHREHYYLHMSMRNFEIMACLLELEFLDGGYIGRISADTLLVKIAKAGGELQQHGKEWEISYEPPPEG